MYKYRIKYVGGPSDYIKAIRTIRGVFELGLRDAKEVMDSIRYTKSSAIYVSNINYTKYQLEVLSNDVISIVSDSPVVMNHFEDGLFEI